MYHSIKLYPISTETQEEFYNSGVNTWDQFHIVPTSRPFVAAPELKSNEVDVPGSDGSIDLTEAPQGRSTYQNRTGSWEFIIMNDFCQPISTHMEWYTAYSNIMDYLHGRRFRVVLEDDAAYFYEGRLTVSDYVSENNYSKITIDYNLAPFKWSIMKTGDDWLWDPFNFDTGIVPSDAYGNQEDFAEFNRIILPCWNSDEDGIYTTRHWKEIHIDPDDLGVAPVTPTIQIRHRYIEADPGMIGVKRGTSQVLFRIPGWSTNRGYENYTNQIPDVHEFKIPEYIFRKGMSETDLLVRCATDISRTTLKAAVYSQELRTCDNCSQVALNPDNQDTIILGESYFQCRCENCNEISEHKFRYAKEESCIRLIFRQGGF